MHRAVQGDKDRERWQALRRSQHRGGVYPVWLPADLGLGHARFGVAMHEDFTKARRYLTAGSIACVAAGSHRGKALQADYPGR